MDPILKESVSKQTDVALEITKQLVVIEFKDKNMVYSPLSIHVVLSLVAAGTKGPTMDQFLSFLKSRSIHHINSLAHDLVTSVLTDGGAARLSFANGVWVDKSLPFKPFFKYVRSDTAYMEALKEVDLKANSEQVRSQVSKWADEETKGLIKVVLPASSVDTDTRLILANALYLF